MIIHNTLSEEILHCKEYECVKEIDEQKFCLAYLDEQMSRPRLVNMQYWKPKKNVKSK